MPPIEEEDDELDFEWKEEDEEEIPEDRPAVLSSLGPVAAWIMGGLVALFVLFLFLRGVLAAWSYFTG